VERNLFRNWSEQQTWLSEKRTLDVWRRSRPCPGKSGGQAMPLAGDSVKTGQCVSANNRGWALCCYDSKASSSCSLARQC